LNLARLENLIGVVSFHGNVIGATPDKSLLKASVLVCHGGADPYVSMKEINTFKNKWIQ
jgi:dienelactone hydrolase